MSIVETNTTKLNDLIVIAIENAIKQKVHEEYARFKKDFEERLEREKSQALAGITLHIMKSIQMDYQGEKLIITIRTEKPN